MQCIFQSTLLPFVLYAKFARDPWCGWNAFAGLPSKSLKLRWGFGVCRQTSLQRVRGELALLLGPWGMLPKDWMRKKRPWQTLYPLYHKQRRTRRWLMDWLLWTMPPWAEVALSTHIRNWNWAVQIFELTSAYMVYSTAHCESNFARLLISRLWSPRSSRLLLSIF